MAQFLFEDISKAFARGLGKRTKKINSINMQALRLGIENFSEPMASLIAVLVPIRKLLIVILGPWARPVDEEFD